jgi:sulfite reductase (NADPH) flavoprotein alpha-component
MKDNAADLLAWLQDGAPLCVRRGLAAQAGGTDAAAAHSSVNELIKTHRYLRDVY